MPDKILFLPHPQVSHAHDTFYNGCLQLFGPENIYECPVVEKYHLTHRNSDKYSWWCNSNNPHVLSLPIQQWIDMINNNEFKYIVGNNRAIELFIDVLAQTNISNSAVIFIEEEHDLGFEVHRRCLEKLKPYYHRIDLHYKMDYVSGRVGSYDKIHPFYMSGSINKLTSEVTSIKPFDERKYDVCYIAGASHPNRKMYYEILKDGLKTGNNIIEYGAHKYDISQYFNLINDSKIFISVRGNEWSNTRNIEGPLLGCALFSEKLEITIPSDYIDGHSAVFFDRNNLIEKLNEYMHDATKLHSLSTASNVHAIKNHTTVARAQQMIDLIKRIKGW